MNRDRDIDASRGIAIFLVVFAHASEVFFFGRDWNAGLFYVWKYIYSFHVPLFFFLSGMVYRRERGRRVVVSAVQLLLVCQISSVIGEIVRYDLYFPNDPAMAFRELAAVLFRGQGFSLILNWFLFCLALVKLAYHGLATQGWRVKAAIGCAVAYSYFLFLDKGSGTFYQAQSILPGLLLYALGHLTARWNPTTRIGSWPARMLLGLALFAAGYGLDLANIGCWFGLGGPCRNFGSHFAVFMLNGEVGIPPLFLASALCSCIGVLLLAAAAGRIWEALAEVAAVLGRYSLDLVLLNGAVLSFLQVQISTLVMGTDWPIAGQIAMALLVTAAQIAFLPIACTLTRPLIRFCGRLAERIVPA